MGNFYTFQNDRGESQQQLDFLTAPLNLPVGKLDADQYSAEDMDGVTESLFGSGNMSFLSMQSEQSNDVLALNKAFSSDVDNMTVSSLSFSNAAIPPIYSAISTQHNFESSSGTFSAHANQTQSDAAPASIEATIQDAFFAPHVSANMGALDLDTATVISETSDYISMGGNIASAQSFGGVRALFSGSTTNNTFVENIVHGDVTEIVNHVVNNEIVSSVTHVVQTILGDTVTNITNNLTDILTGEGHIAVNLDANVLDTVGAHVGIVIEDSIEGDISVGVITDHLNDVVQDLTGLEIPLVADLGATIGFDLLNGGVGTDNAAGDTDLVINGLEHLGIHLPEIVLDPLEGLVGDIDIRLDLPSQLLDPHALLGGVHDIVTNLDDLDIASVPEILDIISAEGLDGALGIELFDHELGQDLALNVGDLLGELPNILGGIIESPNDPSPCDLNPCELVGDVVGGVHDAVGFAVGGILGGAHDVAEDLTVDLGHDVGEIVSDISALPCDLNPCELVGDVADTVHDTVGLLGGIVVAVHDVAEDLTTDLGQDVGEIISDVSALPCDLSNPCELVGDVADTVHDTVGLVGGVVGNIAALDITDPVQNIVEDVAGLIDPALSDALDLLGGNIGDIAGLGDILGNDWTEGGLGNGGLFDDIVHGGGMGDMLPDPIGGLAEGLGALDIPNLAHHSGGGLGGLFG